MKEERNIFQKAAGLSIGVSIVMMIVGLLAMTMPMISGFAVSVLFAWTLVIGGFIYLIYAFTAEGAGGFLWRVLIAVVYMVGGTYLLVNPAITLSALTFAIAVVFVMEGLFQMIGSFTVWGAPGAGWLLFDGIVSIALGLFVGYNWPNDSGWLLGSLVGINLVFSGLNRLMYSAAFKGITAPAH